MLSFSERETLAALYKKWANDNGIRDSAASVVVFVLANNLLDCDKARELIERGGKLKRMFSGQAEKHMRLQNERTLEALACCIDPQRCSYCPRHPKYGFTDSRQEKRCMTELINEAWDVIKRFNKQNSVLHDTNRSLQSTIEKLTKEIERLNGILDEYPVRVKVGNQTAVHSKSTEDYEAFIDDVGTESIREFVKRAKALFRSRKTSYTWRTQQFFYQVLDEVQDEKTPKRKERDRR